MEQDAELVLGDPWIQEETLVYTQTPFAVLLAAGAIFIALLTWEEPHG